MVLKTPGEWILAGCACAGWVFCVGALAYIYGKLFLKTQHVAVVLLLLVSFLPIHFFYNMFCSNHYYSVGIALIRLNSVEGALDFFTKAIRANALNFEYYQYRGNIFASRLNLGQSISPFYGDKDKPSNDYERAIRDFSVVLKQTPYHALIHQDIARLYYTTGVHYVQKAQEIKDPALFRRYQQSAAENFEQARRALNLSLQIDPVNVDSYVLLASMALMAHDTQTAQYWIDAYRRGPAKVTEEKFLARHKNNPQIEFLQHQLDDLQKRLNIK
jgi:tetratricopeptide (TPR) repeat protein